MQWYGYAEDGVGFHFLELPEDEVLASAAPHSFVAIIVANVNKLNPSPLSRSESTGKRHRLRHRLSH
jgi:hypothetical protein